MKKVILIISIFLVIGISIFMGISYKNKKEKEEKENKRIETINNIKSHFNEKVSTNKETSLYDENGSIIGEIGDSVIITLKDVNIDENTNYFYINDINSYIKYEDVTPTEEIHEKNVWYKNYVPFNKNVVAKPTNLYQNDKLIYSFDKEMELPLIIKDTDKYYVEYNDELFYIKKEEATLKDSNNTTAKTRGNIRTLLYHFINLDDAKCDSALCLKASKFEEQIKYLKDNNYFAMRLSDLELFLDGKIRIPEKSIVLTIDDGAQVEHAIPILEKYQIHANLFLVTSWYDPKKLESDYLDIHSHTNNMHNVGVCNKGGQGGAILCWSEEKIAEDLTKSREALNNTTYMSYPFFDFDERAINLVKKNGFTMSFVGAYGVNGVATPGINKFKVPRTTIFYNITMDKFKSYLTNY